MSSRMKLRTLEHKQVKTPIGACEVEAPQTPRSSTQQQLSVPETTHVPLADPHAVGTLGPTSSMVSTRIQQQHKPPAFPTVDDVVARVKDANYPHYDESVLAVYRF